MSGCVGTAGRSTAGCPPLECASVKSCLSHPRSCRSALAHWSSGRPQKTEPANCHAATHTRRQRKALNRSTLIDQLLEREKLQGTPDEGRDALTQLLDDITEAARSMAVILNRSRRDDPLTRSAGLGAEYLTTDSVLWWSKQWTRDPELSHLGLEGRSLHAKICGGALGSANHAA
jgi:hypothetical protein